MIDAVQRTIAEHGLLQHEQKVAVACSGGLDSVVLADVLDRLGYEVVLAHVNYGLRGADSDADAQFVCDWAAERRWQVFTQRIELEGTTAIQDQARQTRYDWFDALCSARGISAVATGHHREDQLETLMQRWLRGAGPKGLSGIPIRRGKLVRPMLHVSGEAIRNHAGKYGLKWREDSSNNSLKYERNRIRLSLIPTLDQTRPGWRETVLAQLERWRSIAEWIHKEADNREAEPLIWPLAEVEPHHPVWWELCERRGFSSRQFESVTALANAQVGALVSAPNYQAVRERNGIRIQHKSLQTQARIFQNESDLLAHFEWQTASSTDVSQFPTDHWAALFDADGLRFPVMLRPWEPGDRFTPLGMSGSVLVSDVLTQRKVPAGVKAGVRLLEDQSGILWIPGIHRSSFALIHSRTKRVLRLQVLANLRDWT